jgi:hypothetical protein
MSDCELSGAAIIIAILGLGVSIYVAYRDRSTVTASARYLKSYQDMSDGIYIHVVNSGRRPVTMRRLLLRTSTGSVIEHRLDKDGKPLRLLENEDHKLQLNTQNSKIKEWSQSMISDAIVEDSRGKEYRVIDLAETINRNAKHLQSAL